MTPNLNLKLVVGSTRQGRQADNVVPWLHDRAAAHGAFDVDVLDLRDHPLPMFGEPPAPGDGHRLAAWTDALAGADAFLFTVPEYNHSIPAVLKNAVDSAAARAFRNRPSGFVGYSGGLVGGARAVEHMAGVLIEAESVPLRNSVLIANVHQAFVRGEPVAHGTEHALRILLDDLAWWGRALHDARRRGELPPASDRRQAA